MEMFDVVLDQIERSTSRKELARKLGTRVKHILAHAMPDEYEEIDLPLDMLVETINYIRASMFKRTYSSEVSGNKHILRSILTWQCAFYRLNDQIDPDQKQMYSHLLLYWERIYSDVLTIMKDIEPILFTYSLNISNSVPEGIQSVKAFCDALPIAVKSVYKIFNNAAAVECKGIMPFLVFYQEVVGAETEWETKMEHWFACHEAHKLLYKEGLDKVQIINRLSNSPLAYLYNFDTHPTAQANAIHKLDKFLNYANHLVNSAANGTFPY